MGRSVSRRQVLASTGLALSGGIAGVGLDAVAGADSWTEVASPTSKTLYAAVRADDGPYAVGGSGNLLHRTTAEWEIVLDDGPSGNNKTLYGASVTDDGERVWMCGASGKLGSYDVSSGEVRNWSSPGGISNSFYDVEVTGPVGDERVHLAMGSGKTVYGKRESSDTFEWETKDTGGSYTITAIEFHTQTDGRAVSEGGDRLRDGLREQRERLEVGRGRRRRHGEPVQRRGQQRRPRLRRRRHRARLARGLHL